MVKKQFLILFCFLFSASISYSSTITELEDSPPIPLEALLQHVKSVLDSSIDECSEMDSACSSRVPIKKPSESDVARSKAISSEIEEMASLYKSCKYGDKKALLNLKLKARKSGYACVLMMKYYANQEKLKGIGNFTSPEFESCLSNFMSLLGAKITALFRFEVIEDPFLNASLALYHQMRGDYALSEQFATVGANQGCIEGYNIIGNLYKSANKAHAITFYLRAAQHESTTGIYKLARFYPAFDKNLIKDLYRHAAIRGASKAYFSLGRWYEKKRQKEKSIAYISYLIETDPYLYVHMEQKEGLGRTAFNVNIAEKLLRIEPSLFPFLLESVYKHYPSKKKRVAHLLAAGYGLGRYGFPYSREDAYHWLDISASEYKNLEDGYQLCCMSAADTQRRESNNKAIAINRHLLESSEFLEKYGTVPQVLLTQLLVAEAESQDNPRFLEEASYWLLKALNCFEGDSLCRRRIVWQIPKSRVRGRFAAVESAHLDTIDGASTFLERQQTFYALGFHHLSGGFEGCNSLVKAQHCFFNAQDFSPNSAYFYVTVISHYLSTQRLMHTLDEGLKSTFITFCNQQEMIKRKNEIATYGIVSGLLDRYGELNGSERIFLKKKIRELSFSNLEYAALSLASWFCFGMFGLNPSIEHEIYWLKLAATKDDKIAQNLLNFRYPLISPLTGVEELALHYSRTHWDDKSVLAVIGGGISGLSTAISFAKSAKEGKISIGKIILVEQKKHLLTGASMIPSREHRGGEYVKDPTTARQCLYGSAIWEQMYGTERILTARKINDFLLAKASDQLERGDDALSTEELIAHYTFLNEHYVHYLEQLVASGKHDQASAEKLLFGASPIFHKLEGMEWESLGLSDHFAAGISTGERGFQPIAMGAMLEYLLRCYNIEVTTGYEVTNIEALTRGGFEIKGKGQPPIYTQYLINAAWHNNSRLGWFLKRSTPCPTPTSDFSSFPALSAKRVFLRCLALVDISECSLPEGRSFFGLVGEHGGMVSCFNDWLASIFLPKEGLSYHGEYTLDEGAVNALPGAARRKLAQLESEKMAVATAILNDAKAKYPFLERAKAKGLSVQTTVSENLDEIFKRTHSNARWVEGVEGCLQVCSTKATFAPFQALQALARFVADKSEDLEANFDDEEARFLEGLIHPEMFKPGTVENVVLPDHFKIISDDSFMSEDQFLAAMRRYAFTRGLDFALFEKTPEAAAVGMNPPYQLGLISEGERIENIDLEDQVLKEDIFTTLFPLLEKRDIELSEVKLGPLDDALDDEIDSLGEGTLLRLQENDHLRNLTLKGWNLTFRSRYSSLAVLLPRLREIHLKGVTFTLKSMQGLFGNEASSFPNLKQLSVVDSHLKKSVFKELIKGIERCGSLEFLDLSGNEIGRESSDETEKYLEELVSKSKKLRYLFLHNNGLFESISLNLLELSFLPLELEANTFLVGITRHPYLQKVTITDNGPASGLLQDRLDSYFLKTQRKA